MTEAKSTRSALVTQLNQLHEREDRQAMAELRRGLREDPGRSPRMAGYVEPYIPERYREHDWRRYYLVASLFAMHPEDRPSARGTYNFGASFRALRGKSDSMDKRFLALLGAEAEDLHVHLRHAVSLLRSEGAGVDYDQLLRDLGQWGHPDRFKQREWARAYFRPPGASEPGDAGNEPAGAADHGDTEED